MGYIFYRIILLNGKKKNVYNKQNSIKLYCKLNGKMIDIKEYKKLCKKPKVKKTVKKKKKKTVKKKSKKTVKTKSKKNKRVVKKGGGFFDFIGWFSNSGKTQDEKDLVKAEANYKELHDSAEKKCAEEREKAMVASREVQRLKYNIEQTNIAKNKVHYNNTEQLPDTNLRDVSTTGVLPPRKENQIGGKKKIRSKY